MDRQVHTDQEAIKRLTEALRMIGNLPLEFNGRARAIAQRTVEPPRGGWRNRLSAEEIEKTLQWGAPRAFREDMKVNTETKDTPTTYTPPEIDMIPVESSNIESVGHDGNETLRVQFKNSGAYDYVGIGEEDFFSLVNADSVGRAYQQLTKGRGIKGIKLQEVA